MKSLNQLGHLIVVAVALCFVALASLCRDRSEQKSDLAQDFTPPSAELLATLSLNHRTLAADLLWLETLQYIGGQSGAQFRYARAFGSLRAVVELNPEFRYAYLFGGLVLTSTMDGVVAADALLEAGRKQFPDEWLFPFYLGFNAMTYRDDPTRAANYFSEASRYAKAPRYVGELAVKLYSEARDCDSSLRILAQLSDNTRDANMLKRLAERRQYVSWECNFQLLEAAVTSYVERFGQAPNSLQQLVEKGVVPGIPPDPYGGVYSLTPQGSVTSSTPKARIKVALPHRIKEQLQKW